MSEYNFANLSWFDFQSLAADLLTAHLQIQFEVFGPGPDGGIDLRNITDSGLTVVQCKHLPRGSGKNAISAFKKELPKVKQIHPIRYILMTTAHLLPNSKQQLLSLFDPYVHTPSDVFGVDDLQHLLRQYPSVERRHIKLWLSSAVVLKAIINASITQRTAQLIEQIEKRIPTYVVNPSYDRAQRLLSENHVCVIAGVAGIGKSTLAEVIMYEHITREFQPVYISGDIDEANQMWEDGEPQIFYYDDFLGRSTRNEHLGKNEDQRLIEFMQRITRHSNKRLLMTTRDYILAQARNLYEKLATPDFDIMKCTIDLKDYTKLIQAEILYNHLYFSDISNHSLAEFVKAKQWVDVLAHPNYTPRIIETSIAHSSKAIGDTGPVDLAERILENLNNPNQMWTRIYNNELNFGSQMLLLVLATMPENNNLEDVSEAWSARMQKNLASIQMTANLSESIREIEGTFVKIEAYGDVKSLKFINPSVRDWILSVIDSLPHEIEHQLTSARYFEQVELLWRYSFKTSAAAPARTSHIQRNLVSNSQLLASAIQSLAYSRSADHYGWLEMANASSLIRRVVSLEQRFTFAAMMLRYIESSAYQTWLERGLQELSDQWLDCTGNKKDAISLAEVIDDPISIETTEKVEAALRWWFTRVLIDVSDYESLADLISARQDLMQPNDLAVARTEFCKWLAAEVETVLLDDDTTELEYYSSVIQQVAKVLAVDVTQILESLEKRIEILENQSEYSDYDEYEAPEPPELIVDEADIDRRIEIMFTSLLDT